MVIHRKHNIFRIIFIIYIAGFLWTPCLRVFRSLISFHLLSQSLSIFPSPPKFLSAEKRGGEGAVNQKRKQRMAQLLTKVGSFWFRRRTNQEISSAGDDINSLSSSIQAGAQWLINKFKGKMQKPLQELLQEYDLPVGIFPRDATNYEFDEVTKKIMVFIPSICEVGYKDSSILRFFSTVTGYLEKGKLSDIEGIKTKVFIWTKVISISTEGSKVHFNTGVKKTRSRDAYEVLRGGIIVDKF